MPEPVNYFHIIATVPAKTTGALNYLAMGLLREDRQKGVHLMMHMLSNIYF